MGHQKTVHHLCGYPNSTTKVAIIKTSIVTLHLAVPSWFSCSRWNSIFLYDAKDAKTKNRIVNFMGFVLRNDVIDSR